MKGIWAWIGIWSGVALPGVAAVGQVVVPPLPDERPVIRTAVEVEGVTFADGDKGIYVPVRELGRSLGVVVGWDGVSRSILFGSHAVAEGETRTLFDGTNLLDVTWLESLGYSVVEEGAGGRKFLVSGGESRSDIWVTVPDKWVEIHLGEQEMRAWQGSRAVMVTPISSGKRGHSTPVGDFRAGPEKTRHRVSRLYEGSPMPYAVQLRGHIFVHGSPIVPRYPASHGCIRVPLTGKNAARFFFDWIDKGSRVRIVREWSEEAQALIEGGRGEGQLRGFGGLGVGEAVELSGDFIRGFGGE